MVLQQLSGINCILFFSGEILAKAGLGQDVSLASCKRLPPPFAAEHGRTP